MTTDENKNSDNISISDLIKWQDSLKKDIDFSKADSEMTPEELAKKVIYLTVDETVEKSLGKDVKKDLDEKRETMEKIEKFQLNLGKVTELGREIEKNFIWQSAYLINHFDKSSENHFRTVVDGMTSDVVSPKETVASPHKILTNDERVDFAKKILEIIKVYRENVIKGLMAKQEILQALLPVFENKLKETNFEIYAKEVGEGGEEMKLQLQEWLELSNKLFIQRKKATEAVQEHLDIDELLPKYVIENKGDITKNLSAMDMKMKGERMVRLINEADSVEKEIEEKRSKLSEQLFGKPESYIELNKSEENKPQQPVLINPLQDKAWFRLAKVVYMIALALALLIGFGIMTEEGSTGFWIIVTVAIIFTIIQKAFYYIVLGKTSWK